MCIGYKKAIAADIPLLAQMNHGLIRDEGSENTMDIPKLAARMEGFLAGAYTALLLLRDADIIGYCLYRNEDPERRGNRIYLRQYYILPSYRRQGLGKQVFMMLAEKVFTEAGEITLDVLENNTAGRAFWESVGFTARYRHMRYQKGQSA